MSKARAKAASAEAEPRWVVAVRTAGVVVWFAMVPLVFTVDWGMRLFWTIMVASLPLFWVVGGYHLWRRICPLSALSQIPRWLGRPGQRKMDGWVAGNAMRVQLGLMVLALTVRLIGGNGTPAVLAGMLGVLSVAALVTGLVYRGKTWCNYLCPVGMVERIYTEPVVLVDSGNSQCTTCTACKKNCPDIDLEQGYWKEADDRSRRTAYFAWPGVVLGFYTWFFLFAGDWHHYFSGEWAYHAVSPGELLGPGLAWLPAVPWLASAPLVLVGFGGVSWGLFEGLDRAWSRQAGGDPERRRHQVLIFAGFTAFSLFYVFAGQPSLRALPDAVRQTVAFGVWFAGAWIFFRRVNRRERDFVREKFARGVLKRWQWGDAPEDPTDLQEVYVVHAERRREQEQRLAAYRETLREMVADGALSRSELSAVDALRVQLGVTEAEHAEIVGQLEAAAAFDTSAAGTAEQRLQLVQYRTEVEAALQRAASGGSPVDEGRLAWLRDLFGIDAAAHEAIVAELRDPKGMVGRQLTEELTAVQHLARTAAAARGSGADPERVALTVDLVRGQVARHLERMFVLVQALSPGLRLPDPWQAACGESPDWVQDLGADAPFDAAALAEALGSACSGQAAPEGLDDPGAPPGSMLAAACAWLRGADEGGFPLARITALRGLSLLRDIPPTELSALAAGLEERPFAPGEALCTFGEQADDVFVIASGRARVWMPDAPDQTVRVCEPGAVVGELAVLDAAPRSAHVTALEPVVALVLPGAEFRSVMARQPVVVQGVVRELVRRLRAAR